MYGLHVGLDAGAVVGECSEGTSFMDFIPCIHTDGHARQPVWKGLGKPWAVQLRGAEESNPRTICLSHS